MNKKVLLRILMAISIAVFVVCAVGLGYELYTNWKSQSYYSEMASGIETRPRDLSNPGGNRPAPAQPDDPEDPSAGTDEPVEEIDPWIPYMDFDALARQLPGAIGWIKLEGTPIDYPVMHGEDNDYFLKYLPDGTEHRNGSIFLDFRNKPDFSEKSIMIYGHMLRTNDMFGYLKYYREQDFYEDHPVIYLHTPQTDYAIVIFASYLLDSAREVPPMRFTGEEGFMEHIENIKSRSILRSDVEVFPDDRIVNLCTCAYDYNNARLVIVGKLVEF